MEVHVSVEAGNVTHRNILGYLLQMFGRAFAASACIVPAGIMAVALYPHTRGIGFPVGLRLAVLAPVCGTLSLFATALYIYTCAPTLSGRRLWALSCIVGFVVLSLISTILRLPPGVSVVTTGIAILGLWWLIPAIARWGDRSVFVLALLSGLGVLVAVCSGVSLRTERIGPPATIGSAFPVPSAIFDVQPRFLNLSSGAKIHYADEGSGPVLLFLHGNPSWSFQWRELITRLKSNYRCIAPDYPGFGMSDAPPDFGFIPREESLIVEEFVHQLKLKDITLVMQDWGGPIGLAFAERRPELIHGLILGSTWAWPTDTSTPRGMYSLIGGGPIGEFIQMNFNGLTEFVVRHEINRKLSTDVTHIYTRPSRPPNRRGVEAFYPGQIDAATPWFRELQVGLSRLRNKPVLIFWALRDTGFTLQDLARFEEAFPDHRTIRFPSAKHFFFEDEFEAMVPQIQTFMSEVAARTAQ
jgi:pimeloyl-ACP methyl ester carboxylesterase